MKKIRVCEDCGLAVLQYYDAATNAISASAGYIGEDGVDEYTHKYICWECHREYTPEEIDNLPLVEGWT